MNLKKVLKNKIQRNIKKYYPEKNLKIKDISQVKTTSFRWINLKQQEKIIEKKTKVFKITLSNEKEIFVKTLGKNKRKNVLQIKKIGEEKILFPKILDYYNDLNSIVMEGITERKNLSHYFPFYSLPFSSNHNKLLFNYMKTVGDVIGNLHFLTFEKRRKTTQSKIFMSEEMSLNKILKNYIGNDLYNQINESIDDIKNEKFSFSQVHRDLNLNNIRIDNGNIYILDYSFDSNFSFVDNSIFLMKLEMLKFRYSIGTRFFNKMINSFNTAYNNSNPKLKIDKEMWNFLFLLRCCYQLSSYKYREANLWYGFWGYIDTKYLIKKIKQLSKTVL